MGDAWIGTQHARRVGHMLTGMEGSYTGPPRHCTRCGARLRQQNHATLCAPCDAKTDLTPDEQAAYDNGYRCEWCERAYIPNRVNQLYCSPTCRSCAHRSKDRARHLNNGTLFRTMNKANGGIIPK